MKTLVLVDAANLYYFANRKFPESKINYSDLLESAKDRGDVLRAIAYGVQRGKADKFIDALNFIGFETEFKETRSSRSNCNVEIAMAMVSARDKVDEIHLYSSDNDLAAVLSWARETGLIVRVYAFGFNPILRNLAAEYIQLGEELLSKDDEADQ